MQTLYNLPRLVRILMIGFVALAMVLAIFALVDRIYIYFLFDPSTIILPSYFSAGVGLLMYCWGWYLFVNMRGTKPTMRRSTRVYVVVSLAVIVIDIVLLVQGLSMTNMVAGLGGFMLRRTLFTGALLLMGLLTACQNNDVALPTLIPTSTAEAVVTETPTTQAEVVATIVPTQAVGRPTLPPTFTPTPTIPVIPTETEVYPTPTLFISQATADTNCNTFDAVFDKSDTQFEIGKSPVITWVGIPGAQLYRIILKESNGRVINDQIYVAETTYTFPGDLFEINKTYGWEVYPVNASNDQMCFAVGLELIPVNPLP